MLAGAHDVVTISNTSHVLHGSVLVIWAHYMIDLAEWIPASKNILIIIDCSFCDSEHEFVLKIFHQ